MKTAVVALVSVIVGLGLGALIFREEPPAPAEKPVETKQLPCPDVQAAVAPSGPVRVAMVDAGTTPAERCSSAEQAVAQLQTELAAMNDRFAAVQAKLDATEKERVDRDGAPIARPQNLPPRFDQETMRTAVENSLKEAGFSKASVTSIDCTEYPCVVYGTGMGTRDDFKKLDNAPSLDPYNDDGRSAWGWNTRGADGGNVQSFGVAFLPKDGANMDELSKRLTYRVQEYQHAGR